MPSNLRSVLAAIVSAALVATALCGVTARAQDTSVVTLDGVEVAGERWFSSVDRPDGARLALRNTTSGPRTIVVIGLFGLDATPRTPLSLRGERSFTLAPGETRTVEIDFDGTAPSLGGGLPYSHFAVALRVGAARGEVLATSGTMCRIPR